MDRRLRCLLAPLLLIVSSVVCGQALYKYQDENGDWIFTDRPPGLGESVEVRELQRGMEPPKVTVTTERVGRDVHFVAKNDFVVPVEVVIALDSLTNLASPPPEQPMRWVVDGGSERTLLELATVGGNSAPSVDFRYVWISGDPAAQHDGNYQYRAPFSVANVYPISQAFPVGITHQTPDSFYAVDLAMPIGTDVYAARDGIVFEVASTNFQGGVDADQYMNTANVVRIMHDDGSQAIYAHLNWNTIRVRPGDRVQRGEYIADSGNTGFSSGPHLHFVVLVNRGMRLVSVPVVFAGPNLSSVEPITGNDLTAY